MAIPFDRNFDVPYGEPIQVSPLITRVLANNPGPLLSEHVEALKRALDGRRVSHILLTHTHTDHSPAAQPLKEWSGAATYAFGPHGSGRDDGVKVEEGGDRDFMPDVRVKDGDVIAGDGFAIECVYTPGHTSNHMCYALREERALFTGDHVMGWSTTVVTPPDGDMAAYMASLRKLRARDDAILWPTHGGPIRDPGPFLQAYIEHRLEREAQILACIYDDIHTIPEMVARMYADVDKRLHPAASRSVLAHLIQLESEGKVMVEDGKYRLK